MSFDKLCLSIQSDFVQKFGTVIEELEAWSEEELFYRRWYELRNDKKALSKFFDSLDPVFLKTPYLVTPDYIAQRKNEYLMPEAQYFNSDKMNRNVLLIKRNRYSPPINHRHEFFEIIIILQGQCTNTIAGKRMVMPAGSLCFIAPDTYHHTEVFDDDTIFVYLMIKHSTFDEVFVSLLASSDILSRFFIRNVYKKNPEYLIFNIADDKYLLEQFLAMLVEQNVNDEKTGRIMESQLLIFFSMLMRKYGNSPLVYEQVGIKEQYWEIIAYINKHFRTLTHAKLAEKFNLSVAYCSRIIKSITGKNFTVLVNDLRMNQARSMLSQSDAKIYDISFSLGYEDQGTFIRNFKKAHGITPAQYRKNNTG